ncbi:MAG: flavin-dependent oxidoreductase [Phenylobacterium sp.]|uniref:flavin-dependent oxidoreductase n=1 Tax=Phenylobacterium sp. TaxID=1871053 RepID=UPI001A56CA5D|nr:flavin-dependent oxidoreductase [Phenylobacterium sp.]MBL8554007.1 flavin-dependent oxidoreductase [Phenylobacterium sp.]
MKIAIVGAGISGLTTALSLHAAGLPATVFEAVARPAPLGVGINVLPHAMRELTALGLLPDLRAAGVEIDELVYLMKDGREIWRERRGLAAGYAWPQVAIHRGELQTRLLAAVQARLGPQAVRFGHALQRLETGDDGVTAHFADRATGAPAGRVEADVLIAADGIHSAARRQFYPDEGRPRWNGVTLYRSTSRSGKVLGGRSMLWAGHARQKFVAYPIGYDPETGETRLNWICDLKTAEPGAAPPAEDWNRQGDRAALMAPYAAWRWPGVDVPALIAASEGIYEFPMVDRDPLPRWTFGRTTLLGDAAHPMYPIGSNGATQGIIDARAVAFHLATAPTPGEALSRYEAERRPATGRIVLTNRQGGPDTVMELAEQRAPDPADDLDALVPMAERQAIADGYKRVAGFDPAALTAPSQYVAPR